MEIDYFFKNQNDLIKGQLESLFNGGIDSHYYILNYFRDQTYIIPREIREKNFKPSIEILINESTNKGNIYAKSLFGFMLVNGLLVTKDEQLGLRYLMEAVNRENPLGYLLLGFYYLKNISDEKIQKKSDALIKKAYVKAKDSGIVNIAYGLSLDEADKESFEEFESTKYFKIAYTLGMPEANGYLGMYYHMKGDYFQAYQLFKKYSFLPNQWIEHFLGLYTEHGLIEHKKDHIAALKKYLNAKRLGCHLSELAMDRYQSCKNTDVQVIVSNIREKFTERKKKYLTSNTSEYKKLISPQNIFDEMSDLFDMLAKFSLEDSIEKDNLIKMQECRNELSQNSKEYAKKINRIEIFKKFTTVYTAISFNDEFLSMNALENITSDKLNEIYYKQKDEFNLGRFENNLIRGLELKVIDGIVYKAFIKSSKLIKENFESFKDSYAVLLYLISNATSLNDNNFIATNVIIDRIIRLSSNNLSNEIAAISKNIVNLIKLNTTIINDIGRYRFILESLQKTMVYASYLSYMTIDNYDYLNSIDFLDAKSLDNIARKVMNKEENDTYAHISIGLFDNDEKFSIQ